MRGSTVTYDAAGIINRNQHGFLQRKSTTTQLLECCLDWNIALNTHQHLDIIYLDYAKANKVSKLDSLLGNDLGISYKNVVGLYMVLG